MKSKIPLFLLISFLSATPLFAQEIIVKGRLIDADDSRPLEFANIALLHLADSSVITGSMTDGNGRFEFTTEPGDYLLRLGFVGYEQRFREINLSADQAEVALGNLELVSGSRQLEEVTVEGMAQLFESDIDKRVYNVENSIVAEGGTAQDVLETLPSVQVDEEGNISMRGSGNIVIFINGRPTNLSADDTESVLQQFPANSIAKVELITNPSARYDAAGVGGIINIILKENQRQGLNGQVNAGVGTRNKYNGGLNLNYGAGKFNVFANYNYQYRELFQISESLRENFRPTGSRFLDQDYYTVNKDATQMIRTGFDVQLNDRNTFGFYAQGNFRDRSRSRLYNQRHQNINRGLDSLFVRDLREDQQSQNYELGVTYDLELDTLGQKLYFTSSYAYGNTDRIEFFDQQFFNEGRELVPENRQDQIYERPRRSRLFIAQIDYEKPIGDGMIELGLKSTLNRSDRDQIFQERIFPETNFIVNDTVTNSFLYDEDVHAAYFIYKNKLGDFGYQAGLRGELSLTESFQGNNEITFTNNYFNLFPSLYLSYDMGDE